MSALYLWSLLWRVLRLMPRTPAARVLLPSGLLERSKNELAFGVLDGRSNRDHQIGLGHLRRRLGSHAERRRQMLGAYHVTRADDDSPLDRVPKLAHVSGPPMPSENVQRVLVDAADAAAVT